VEDLLGPVRKLMACQSITTKFDLLSEELIPEWTNAIWSLLFDTELKFCPEDSVDTAITYLANNNDFSMYFPE
jgi:hypothetical protein